jgi:HD-like signal output (HDOD) protein
MSADDFSRLEILCRRVATLPVLPATALQLIRMIDSGDASAAELEKIIVHDPSLSAEFLRISANSMLGKSQIHPTTIKAGILRMGQRGVRALATSVLVRDLVNSDSSSPLNKKRFGQHSLAVGLLAKFVFARRKMKGAFESAWSPDEIFATGLLSDISYVLLAKMLPDTYARLHAFARKKQVSLDDMFIAAFKEPASKLGAAASHTWGLPDLFGTSLMHLNKPWEAPEESIAISCLNYAGALAKDFGLGLEEWDLQVAVEPQVDHEVGLSEEERANLKDALLIQLESYGEGLKAA